MSGGTGGSASRPSEVMALNRIKCRVVSQSCKGCFTCSEVPADLWKDYKRYDYDFDTYHQFWTQRQAQNETEEANPFGYAAVYVQIR